VTTDQLIAELTETASELERHEEWSTARPLRIAIARLKSAEIGMGVMVGMKLTSDQLAILHRWRSGMADDNGAMEANRAE
jgi:hypothetical protein